MELYKDNAKKFSASRQYPWKGWERALSYLNQTDLSVLDLGCGNGRFLKYINNLGKFQIKKYLGVDNSKPLLAIANSNLNKELGSKDVNWNLKNLNLNKAGWCRDIEVYDNFNLIVAFGITHHIEPAARNVFFECIVNLLSKNGLAIVTFWNFKLLKGWKEKVIEELGKEDYILSFGAEKSRRYCHYYSEDEIYSYIAGANLKVVGNFVSDGKDDKLNRYYILSK